MIERARATKLLAFRGLARVPVERAEAGDIIAIAGLQTATVADTLCDHRSRNADPGARRSIRRPGDHHFGQRFAAGRPRRRQGAKPRHPRPPAARGGRQCRDPDQRIRRRSFEVAGRGELQLGVLIETMRREGFELSISRPRVLFQTDPETRREAGADRGSDDRRRRSLYRRRHREDQPAQRRAAGHASDRRAAKRGWCSSRRRAASSAITANS